MTTLHDIQTWKGLKAVDADGDKIGTIEGLYLDRHTGEPAWATVKTGLFGMKSSFVPIHDAEQIDDDHVRVPVDKEQVKDAPKITADGDLDPEQERRLYEYYGRTDYPDWQGEDRTTRLDDLAGVDPGQDTGAPAVVGVRLRRVVIVTSPPPDDR